jgi:DNA-binding CsgD family transcriptional regulator
VDWYAGRLETVGLQLGPHARALGEQAQEPEYGAWVTRVTALAEAELGLFAQARATAERGAALARSVDDEIDLIGNLAALGHLALLQRDVRAAAHHLRDLPERLAASGHASASLNCSADAVEALVGVGDLEDAERCLATFMTLAPRLNGWARVGAWRSKGLIAAAEGDRDGAVAAFEQALAMDGATPMYPLERGRTLLALGVTLHRDGRRRDARETIERALNLFTQLGATVRGAHARVELARISGRRRRSDGELTSAERRVAALAAQGKRNTEIAAELFIEVGTVERHLTHAYRKLGVRSRTELAGRFAGAGETVAR